MQSDEIAEAVLKLKSEVKLSILDCLISTNSQTDLIRQNKARL
jgi:hypothetical protein